MTVATDNDRVVVNMWASRSLRDRLDEEAARHGMSRSAYSRLLLCKELGVPLEPAYSRAPRAVSR